MGTIVLWSLGSAACYVLATFIMKRWDAIGNVQAVIFVAVTLAGAVLLETEALRQARLAYVFILILGFETSLAMLCGWLLLREAYVLREVLGLPLIIAGVAITRLPSAVQST
jgi:multidrug transporter EmrE-like cation transporter